MPVAERIAIVGFAGRFPGSGPDLDVFWQNVTSGTDCGTPVPAGRWLLPPDEILDGRSARPDSVYSSRGYFLDPFDPDLTGLAVAAGFVAALDPLFHLVLDVGNRAWQTARTGAVDRRRAGVILGNICLPTDRASDLAREYLARPRRNTGGKPDSPTHPLNRYAAGLPAGLLAKALGLGAGSFTLDAACASSIYALKLACDELLAGRADVMLAGGASRPDSLYTQMGFCQLRALSPRGTCSPFDAAADGLVVGEGAGVFVLKRLTDALRQGDDIHGVICGVGLSNDMHGNLLAPAKEGQLRAMRAAYTQAGWKPTAPDVIECHATGTPVGDAVEFDSLRELWGADGWKPGICAIGSVKSTVGHLLTGAGAAALTKVLLGMGHGQKPPQANFANPNPTLAYRDGPFRVLTRPEYWDPRRPTLPRRAAVSGFGFGGVNGHLLVENYVGQTYTPGTGLTSVRPQQATPTTPVMAPVTAPTPPGPPSRLLAKLNALMAKHADAFGSTPAQAPTPTPPPEADPTPEGIAVVGLAAHFGPWPDLRSFQEHVLGGAGGPAPTVKTAGWERAGRPAPAGFVIDRVAVPLDRFRIPPKELADTLPQQLLMLTTAAAALDDCHGEASAATTDDPRTGVFIGLTLDPNTTNFHLRWAAKARGADPDVVGPPLTADRTMGALGSVAASRVARAFHFGGPSFTVCSEEAGAARAVELAVHALRTNEIDRAVAGGVDLAGDPRAVLASDALRPFNLDGRAAPLGAAGAGAAVGEGAAALVLKRLSDAERDGDRVYAVIRGVGAASGGAADGLAPDAAAYASSLMRACTDARADPAQVDYVEVAGTGCPVDDKPEAEAIGALLAAKPRPSPVTLSGVRGQVGQAGAASAGAGLVKACLGLYQQVLPPTLDTDVLRPELARVAAATPRASRPRYWLRNASDGPRRAIVAATGVDGSAVHVVLEEYVPATTAGGATAVREAERAQPLGLRPEAVFAIEADTPDELLTLAGKLAALAARSAARPVEALAREWFAATPPAPAAKRAVAFVARTAAELGEQLRFARDWLQTRPDERIAADLPDPRPAVRDRVFYAPSPLGPRAKVAVVFPGSGNHFAGMGQALGVQWPAVLRRQEAENLRLRDQYAPDLFWADRLPAAATPRDFLFGQVTLGTLTADLLAALGVPADALLGQSLGESAGLFGLRVWRDRDGMLGRLRESTLFTSDLAPPYRAAQAFWGLPAGEPVDWVAGVLTVPADGVRAALRPELRAYLLIATTPAECVVGGVRADVEKLVAQFDGSTFLPLSGLTLAHCEAGKPVEKPYRELHTLPTTVPAGLTVYSGAYGRAYVPTPAACADSITAGLLGPIDFPAAVEAAYKDGVRVFAEAGPGQSATRMVGAILAGRPHLARAVCVPRQDDTSLVLRLVANLLAERGRVTLDALYVEPVAAAGLVPPAAGARTVTVPVGLPAPRSDAPAPVPVVPPAPVPEPDPEPEAWEVPAEVAAEVPAAGWADDFPAADAVPVSEPMGTGYLPAFAPGEQSALGLSALLGGDDEDGFTPVAVDVYVNGSAPVPPAGPPAEWVTPQPVVDLPPIPPPPPPVRPPVDAAHARMVAMLLGYDEDDGPPTPAPLPAAPAPADVPRSLDTEQCFTFARGKIGDVLGPTFAAIDEFPTRVRLPDGPLMLVDHVRSIDGVPLSLGRGGVVTDHAVHADRWYLDAGRCPTSVTVEAGQADLFLAGFLGIDLQTRGLAVYRLLDAVVTFHRELPRVGETVVYDIHIDEFTRQADAWLFRFRFEGTIDGRPLLSMQNGVAGFFTEADLAAGKGIVHTRLDRMPLPGVKPADWSPLVPFEPGSLAADQVQALHRGDLAAAFGPAFAAVAVASPLKLPAGMLRLLDRVPALDPTGGRFGLGFVRGEYDIQPSEWFIDCHFVDDKVMPGTLMYECCLHTLRVFLMRLGWVGEDGHVVCEPVPGVASRLKCRGQVLQSTTTVTYEVSVKELGYRPEPYCVADALMYADGKPIVEITNLSLRMSGLTREGLTAAWHATRDDEPAADEKPALYDKGRILAYSNGDPSDAFGEPYRVFDRDRVLARLPGPPFQFLDRVTGIVGDPFVMKAGAACEAEYDVPPDAWYFAAERSGRMPFSVLLETALQPCGWLAAYCGSALTSPTDLSFRNLGGSATQHRAVKPAAGTLTTAVKLTRVSSSVGMVIQHYDLSVKSSAGVVYSGTTYFGFFAKDALQNQVGMPAAKVPFLTAEQMASPELVSGELPHAAPFPLPQLRMVDTIDGYLPTGGRAGLGLVQGRIAVDPAAWFFQAHFYQDPVWPGSLGLESFLQLLKFAAIQRYGNAPQAGWQAAGLGRKHEWVYRGQVVPADKEVKVVLEVTHADDAARRLTADGFLTVDGRIIYQMTGFTLE